MKVLLARLYERARQEEAQSQSAQRMGLIGSGDRSERIRTYNFPQVVASAGIFEANNAALMQLCILHSNLSLVLFV